MNYFKKFFSLFKRKTETESYSINVNGKKIFVEFDKDSGKKV